MTEHTVIWESCNTPEARKALEQVGISTGRRERKKLSSKGIAVVFKRGDKIVKQENGREIIIKENVKPFRKIKVDTNGVAGCINRD